MGSGLNSAVAMIACPRPAEAAKVPWSISVHVATASMVAMETAPEARSPLTQAEHADVVTVDSGSLSVSVDRRSMELNIAATGGPGLLTQVTIAAPAAGGPWTLTEALAPGERLFGLGQDNHNNGRLDRRGVEWAFYESASRLIPPGESVTLLYDDWDRNPYESPFGAFPHELLPPRKTSLVPCRSRHT